MRHCDRSTSGAGLHHRVAVNAAGAGRALVGWAVVLLLAATLAGGCPGGPPDAPGTDPDDSSGAVPSPPTASTPIWPGPATTHLGGRPLETVFADLEQRIPELMDRWDVPGLSVAVIVDGRVAWARGFGVKDLRTGEPVTTVSLFRGASFTKPLVAYAALKLCEQGRLDLDRPLDQYLSEPYLRDARVRDVTLRMVLSHTSGFSALESGRGYLWFEPGTRFAYSNDAFRYLQYVMEQVTGRPLADHLRETVFEPLGLRETTLVFAEGLDGLVARGHDGASPVTLYRPAEAHGAYGVYTTATDYAKFLIELMLPSGEADHPYRLAPETVGEMLSPQVTVNDYIAWALGLGVERAGEGRTAYNWQWGWITGYRNYFAFSPERGVGVVILTNGSTGLHICEEIAETALGDVQPAFDAYLDQFLD